MQPQNTLNEKNLKKIPMFGAELNLEEIKEEPSKVTQKDSDLHLIQPQNSGEATFKPVQN